MEDSTDGIGLDTNEGVVNGQHRLTAIAEGNIAVDALVVRNVRPEVIKVIDQGIPRSLQQILAMTGEYEYTTHLAGAIKYLWRISNDFEKSLPGAQAPTIPQLLEFFEHHKSITDSVSVAVDVARPFKGVQPAWLAAYNYVMASVDLETADDFFGKLEKGTEIANGDPVHALREKLLANSVATKPEPGTVLAAWVVKAWEATVVGQTMTTKTLKFISKGARAEAFPKVSGVAFNQFGQLVLVEPDGTDEAEDVA